MFTAENLIILFNLFILESLLSIDNAAVLAVMVKDLPEDKRPKALKYGILGAFVFRALCLFMASWLIKIIWLKIAGGLYLLYLVYGHFRSKKDEESTDGNDEPVANPGYIQKLVGQFWATVIMVEIMDIAFSIDNIFAAVAMTDSLPLIIIGVCIGIISMRFVATWFTKLMSKFPSLERSAFIVILLLGLRLIVSGAVDYIPAAIIVKNILDAHWFDLVFSGIMMLIFFMPIAVNSFKKKSKRMTLIVGDSAHGETRATIPKQRDNTLIIIAGRRGTGKADYTREIIRHRNKNNSDNKKPNK